MVGPKQDKYSQNKKLVATNSACISLDGTLNIFFLDEVMQI